MILKFTKYFLLLFALAIACEKKPFDYRNKFCGTYDFKFIELSWTTNNGFYPANEGNYSGKVYYDKKAETDQIIIDFIDNRTLTFTVDRQGKATGCGSIGQFEKRKSLSFEYRTSSCPGGGLGGGTNYTVTGTKK